VVGRERSVALASLGSLVLALGGCGRVNYDAEEVVAVDAAKIVDAKIADAMVDAAPACSLVVYTTAAKGNGNFGGRAGLDSFCAGDSNLPAGCVDAHALISVDAADSMQSMPTTFAIDSSQPLCWHNSNNGGMTLFANDWADMFDGTISTSRAEGTGVDAHTWTGSNNAGTIYDDTRSHCTNWTASSLSNNYAGGDWNYRYWITSNVGSGAVSMPNATSNWLNTQSTHATKVAYGPATCCAFDQFTCPSPCPTPDTLELDLLTCGGESQLMCVCQLP
jgi:hypothetical protein